MSDFMQGLDGDFFIQDKLSEPFEHFDCVTLGDLQILHALPRSPPCRRQPCNQSANQEYPSPLRVLLINFHSVLLKLAHRNME